tara:strand:- start:1287 stop:2117 length:831 start_codon:yes stop_codon:yes gene_type:complete
MKTAIIAILPAMLLSSAAQAQIGGVTDTAGSAVEQVADPARAGQFGQTGTDFTSSRIGATRAGMEARQAREARRAARRAGTASETASLQTGSQAAIQSDVGNGSVTTGTEVSATAQSETVQAIETAARTATEPPLAGDSSLEAAVQDQLAEIQAASTASTARASQSIAEARLAPAVQASAPAPARITYVDGSSGDYRSPRRDTVIVRDQQTATATQASAADTAAIRFEQQRPQRAEPAQASGGSSSTGIWPFIIAGLLIALLLGLSRQLGQRSRAL